MRAILIALLLAGCSQPDTAIFTDSNGHERTRKASDTKCLALVRRAGQEIATSGLKVELPDDYPRKLYLLCMIRSGQFI